VSAGYGDHKKLTLLSFAVGNTQLKWLFTASCCRNGDGCEEHEEREKLHHGMRVQLED